MTHGVVPMQPQDWSVVRAIIKEGLATGLAAFVLNPPLWKDWDAKYFAFGRFVARRGDTILGWAALAAVPDN